MIAVCLIQGKKPSRCVNYPTVYDFIPTVCGFRFLPDGTRIGSCKRCGACCAVPRVNGEPGGGWDPSGKPCKHLDFEEA